LHAFFLGLLLHFLRRLARRLLLLGRLRRTAEWVTLHEPSYSEISCTTWPVFVSSPWRATSACATTPTSRPSSSTTGRRRTWCCAIRRNASSRPCSGSRVTRFFEATSRTGVDLGSFPSATTRI